MSVNSGAKNAKLAPGVYGSPYGLSAASVQGQVALDGAVRVALHVFQSQ